MGALIRAKDWSQTPLGSPETWPPSLRIAVSIMLDTHFGMHIAWGEQYIQLYNDGYRPVLGNTKHPAALGRPIQESFPEIWASFIQPKFADVMRGEPFGAENLLVSQERNGYLEEGYFTFSYSPIRDENGRVAGVLTTESETTEHVIRERRLQTSRNVAGRLSGVSTPTDVAEAFLQTLRENAYDVPFALLYVTEGGVSRLQGSVGLGSGEAAAPDTFDETAKTGWPLSEVLDAGTPRLLTDLPERFGPLTGGAWPEPTHSAYVVPIQRLDRGQPYGVVVYGINPRRAFDELYREFLDSLTNQLTRAFVTASALAEERRRIEALEDIDRAKTVFFSNVSHEFRTPLTLLLGPLESALRGEAGRLSDSLRHELETAHRNGQRLQKLVNALLDFSRIEAGRMQAHYQPVDLATLTADLASGFRSAIEKAGMAFVVDCPPLPKPVYVDHDQWEKIVLNLLSNAFKYTLSGRITVRLRSEEGAAVFQVEDTGVGIAADELPRLFERFHRVASSQGRSYEGTGIGLSLVRELVGMHQGQIDVASEPGVGSTFTVRLPLGKEHLPAEQISEQPAPDRATRSIDAYLAEVLGSVPERAELVPARPGYATPVVAEKKAHILLADDNADMRAYVSRLLEAQYRVTAVPDGRAALDALAQDRPDLVLSDIMMPYVDGFELLKSLKTDPHTARIPVILLSARAGEEARIDGYEAGADDYLVKPFSANELRARVQAHLTTAQVRTESERQLRFLFEQVPVAIAIFRGPELIVELANEQHLRFWGRRLDEVLGRPVFEAIPEVRNQGYEAILARVLQTGEAWSAKEQYVQLNRNGRLEGLWVNIVYEPLREGDRVVGLTEVVTDVTEQVQARRKIEASQQQLQLLFEQAPVGIAMVRGPEHTFELANEFYVSLVGRNHAHELIGKPLLEAMPELEGQGFDQLLTNVVRTGVPFVAKEQSVVLQRNEKLETLYVDFVYQPLPAPDSGVFVVVTDVTQQVQVRRKIEESETRFRQLADSMPQMVWATLPDGYHDFYNQRWYAFTGLDYEQTKAEGWSTILHPDDYDRAWAVWRESLETGKTYEIEYRMRRHDGVYVWQLGRALPIRDEAGTIVRWYGTCTDIDAQKRAETALSESERRFRVMSDAMPQKVWTADAQGNVNYFNRFWLDYTGMTTEELQGWGWKRIIHPDDWEANQRTWQASIDTGQDFELEHRFLRHDGVYRWHLSRGLPQRDESGQVLTWIGTNTDVHDQKTAAEQLEELVSERTRELRELNAELERSNLDLMQFAYVASHDLKEPLRKIQLFGGLLEQEIGAALSERGRKHLDVITSAANRMQLLVEDVLNLSRLSQKDAAYERVDLNELIGAISEDLEVMIREKNARIEADPLPQIEAVRGQMHQLFQNLITNGLKFNESPVPIVRIEAPTPPPGQVVFLVRDNGIGFAEEFQEQMFSMFQRLNGRKYAGTGIGLTICRKIVENHRGHIEASSTPGQGSTFRVTLPVGSELR